MSDMTSPPPVPPQPPQAGQVPPAPQPVPVPQPVPGQGYPGQPYAPQPGQPQPGPFPVGQPQPWYPPGQGPQPGQQPGLQPGQPLYAQAWGVPQYLGVPPQPKRERPWLRTLLRWSVAGVVFLAVGSLTTLAVSLPKRTDMPGLKTPGDNRYVFPALQLPELPPNGLGPAEGAAQNGTTVHLADLRGLLLPAPVGAKTDASYPGAKGWYPQAAYAAKFTDATELAAKFADYGLRHIAATAWTGPDGTRTEIYLLAFRSSSSASVLYNYDVSSTQPAAAPTVIAQDDVTFPALNGTSVTTLAESSGAPAPTDLAFMNNGDVEAVILMTNAKAINPVTFNQVVTLQGELLQG
ncbi:hypothetical protein [Streptacidiphilus albus]|uniref:hypothetical protein n=1 Tax=Streptacidiphilus albus TaxID=105425 RepID=UPI00068C2A64|nr:hypothetical protein [Streptacidiphilus albus]